VSSKFLTAQKQGLEPTIKAYAKLASTINNKYLLVTSSASDFENPLSKGNTGMSPQAVHNIIPETAAAPSILK
jgi:hypothetical protein